MKTYPRLGLPLALAVLFVVSLGTSAFARTYHTNRGKHMVEGHGASHKGGYYAASSSKRRLVGGHGAPHKGGH